MTTTDPSSTNTTALVIRLGALLDALRAGPLKRPDLLSRLCGNVYPATASARRMIDRDIERLKDLGIVIERDSTTRPPVYRLHGGTPVFCDEELRTLALLRDSFDERHPQSARVHTLLERLTQHLNEEERHSYTRRQALRMPVHPAIDYTPYAGLLARLEEAISRQQTLAFHYKPVDKARATLHREVEPYEIEYYERHFYLVAYSYNTRRVHDFRVDRIEYDEVFGVVPGGSWSWPQRRMITFRYRLAAVLAQGEISQRFENQRVVERLPNGDVIIEAEGRSDFFIRRMLLKYASNAELLEPEWLRELIRQEVAGLVQVYGLE